MNFYYAFVSLLFGCDEQLNKRTQIIFFKIVHEDLSSYLHDDPNKVIKLNLQIISLCKHWNKPIYPYSEKIKKKRKAASTHTPSLTHTPLILISSWIISSQTFTQSSVGNEVL